MQGSVCAPWVTPHSSGCNSGGAAARTQHGAGAETHGAARVCAVRRGHRPTPGARQPSTGHGVHQPQLPHPALRHLQVSGAWGRRRQMVVPWGLRAAVPSFRVLASVTCSVVPVSRCLVSGAFSPRACCWSRNHPAPTVTTACLPGQSAPLEFPYTEPAQLGGEFVWLRSI